jgi:hypothetical protein
MFRIQPQTDPAATMRPIDSTPTRPRTCAACGTRCSTRTCMRCLNTIGTRGPWYETRCPTCRMANWASLSLEHTDGVAPCAWCDSPMRDKAHTFGAETLPPDLDRSHTVARIVVDALCTKHPHQVVQKHPQIRIKTDVMQCSICRNQCVFEVWTLHMSNGDTQRRGVCASCKMTILSYRYFDIRTREWVRVVSGDPIACVTSTRGSEWEVTLM